MSAEDDAHQVAAVLRTMLAGIAEAPDTSADPLHLAYLRGAADALEVAAGPAGQGRPDLRKSGHADRDSSANESPQVG
jgi:hypothetical protein